MVEAVGPEVTGLRPRATWSGVCGATGRTPSSRSRSWTGTGCRPASTLLIGTFDRVGAVALDSVLAAGAFLGETVVVFGQGVIGLLTTQLLAGQGIEVLAVDTNTRPARVGAPVRRDPGAGRRRRRT